ncbi:copper resistance CopC family protein [Rothia sp. P4278]|uniref:copper resistance CopC family protein n=1 Tax=Rothia sp. P4278 TaxID=3402658 RepID=UPI003AE47D9A
MTKAHTASTTARAFLAVATLAGTSLLGISAATAHDELISTNPADGSSLSQAPRQLELTFSGNIMQMDGANQVRVTNAAGEDVTQGDPQVKGTSVTQGLTAGDEDETYTVAWRVVSSDGHPIQGTLTYDVGQGASTDAGSTVTATNPSSSAASNAAVSDPVASATEGLSTPMKIVLAVVAAAALGTALTVVLAKTKRK